jgi:hypothetical protein
VNGTRAGDTVGPRVGVAVGGLGGSTDPFAGVTIDAASGMRLPANAAESTIFMSAVGIGGAGFSSIWNCQEASGNLADAVGGVTLTQSGAGHLYRQAVAGMTRLAATTTDGTVGQKWLNTTTAPDPATVSAAWFALVRMPAANPAAARCLMANGGTLDFRIQTTGVVRIINGAGTNGLSAMAGGGVHLLMLRRNVTASTFVGFTDLEKIVGTFGAVASNPMFVLGGQTAAAADAGYLWTGIISGAAAELSDAQMKAIAEGILADTVPWS